MHVSDVNVGNSVLAVAAQQMQAVTEMQMELIKSMAESQEQLVAMLNASGLGLNVDTQA
jgi:hypothetical protein